MNSDLDSLADTVRQRRAILFAGAGLSMSVGLPSWRELIGHMCRELDLDVAALGHELSYQTLAEYYRLQKGSIGPLRSWMDRTWSVSEEKVRRSRIHRLIVELDFPIIYTTNYDNNLEVAHRLFGRPFVKVASPRDIAEAHGDTTQIVKFHGDFEDDASLVIAETDYFNRLNFASPLDIKFRADALGRTILFVGYSMSDLNIRLLLHRLWLTWRDSGQQKDRPPSYVFMPQPNPVQEAVLGQWGIRVLSGDSEDPEQALLGFLGRLSEEVGRRGRAA
ncbi:SIR2 family protein [Phenylobacterium sp.]|uniref:SIR2 family NAD-dependent protein deacylase n=1 Tax=Phenylobacterium sp. TaxID=1871053 RepID=UPI0035B11A1F